MAPPVNEWVLFDGRFIAPYDMRIWYKVTAQIVAFSGETRVAYVNVHEMEDGFVDIAEDCWVGILQTRIFIEKL
jgi:hypothetical protein